MKPDNVTTPSTATRYDENGVEHTSEVLTVEAPLHIRVNGEAFTTTMRTPGADAVLARGLLFTEGVLADGSADMAFTEVQDPERRGTACIEIEVNPASLAKPIAGRRTLFASASCGVCGTRDPEDIEIYGPAIVIPDGFSLAFEMIDEMSARMRERQSTFTASGGCHAAAIFDAAGELLCVHEDVGRHNAVDKCVGTLLAGRTLDNARALFVSGRISYEIVYKAYRAGIAVVLAVSAASSMAVETAERLGITLAGFCRDGRATVYTHSGRIAALAARR